MPNRFKPDTSVGFRHETLPPDEPDCPYLDRWVLGVGRPSRPCWFSIRLHHFFRSDDDHLHDHPTWFLTLVLKGTYDDVIACRECVPERDVDRLYELWQDRTGRPGSPITAEDRALCEPFVKEYGFDVVDRAIAGIAYDHHVTQTKRYNTWGFLFRNREGFEDCAHRAPWSWNPAVCEFCRGSGQVVGDHMRFGSIRFRPALHSHRVVTDGCWTLLLFGPRKRDWGFWAPEGWLRQRTYFQKYGGAAACREADSYEEEA